MLAGHQPREFVPRDKAAPTLGQAGYPLPSFLASAPYRSDNCKMRQDGLSAPPSPFASRHFTAAAPRWLA
ncbi:MAG: hypothetical protein KDD73_07495 [Anaerolineales bacterium]|nr:hypothetical protein [Anaerolineales bacterium]MCB9128807.1 hypothetical protein [Ardenticatenales bacterium]MCB9171371.1 hypothetical protein [Ardenticatenales bacterium]